MMEKQDIYRRAEDGGYGCLFRLLHFVLPGVKCKIHLPLRGRPSPLERVAAIGCRERFCGAPKAPPPTRIIPIVGEGLDPPLTLRN